MALTDTHATFQAKVGKLADLTGKAPEAIYELWRKYSAQCQVYDQSALLWEFVQWYKADLGADLGAMIEAVK